MFEDASSFNQPIGNWNISTFCDLRNMFKNSTSFNQDISEWNFHGLYSVYSDYVDNSYKESYFINNTSISTFNYDKLIKNITLKYISGNYQRSSIIFYNNNVSYCNETYRDYLINEKG